MATKIVVITGSTAGLGYHCAQFLAKSSSVTCVILACRNTIAANKAADEIRAASTSNSEPKNIIVLPEPCDLSDLKSVRAYSIALKVWLAGRQISALVNNAGIGGTLKHSKNAEGHEMIFATNHLGHFLLTILLLPSITDCIINVSSEVHDPSTKTYAPDPEIGYPRNNEEYNIKLLAGEPLEGENDATSGQRRYSRSKLCNVLFTNELAFRLSGNVPSTLDESVRTAALLLPQKASCNLPNAKNIRCLSYNPGLMLDTSFASSSLGAAIGWIVYILVPVLRFTPLGHLMRTAPLSGGRLGRLALGEIGVDKGEREGEADKEGREKEGREEGRAVAPAYYSDESSVPSSAFSRSLIAVTKHQKDLWDLTVIWAGVSRTDLDLAGL